MVPRPSSVSASSFSFFPFPLLSFLAHPPGWTALHVTCYYAHRKVVKELLSCPRTEVNVKNKDGWTACMAGSRLDGDGASLRLANPFLFPPPPFASPGAVHCAAMQGYADLCDQLIRRRASIDIVSNDGSTHCSHVRKDENGANRGKAHQGHHSNDRHSSPSCGTGESRDCCSASCKLWFLFLLFLLLCCLAFYSTISHVEYYP